MQNLPVVLALDRGGFVGDDGPTHHGLFDFSYLRAIPNMIVMAPKDENELQHMLATAVACGRPASVRYPRGAGVGVTMDDTPQALPIWPQLSAKARRIRSDPARPSPLGAPSYRSLPSVAEVTPGLRVLHPKEHPALQFRGSSR